MSLLKKYDEVFMNKDEAGMNEVLHDDYKFTMHASGKVLTKQDVIQWAMSDDINRETRFELFMKMMKLGLSTHL